MARSKRASSTSKERATSLSGSSWVSTFMADLRSPCPWWVDAEQAKWARSITDEPISSVWSGRRDSNPRPSPWQGDALPLSHFRVSAHPFYLTFTLFAKFRSLHRYFRHG